MMNPKVAGTLSSQSIVQDVEKDAETLGVYEVLSCSDKWIFMGCSFNGRASIVFNKLTKSLMDPKKILG